MIKKALLQPTSEDTFNIIYDPAGKGGITYEQALQKAITQESDGDIEGACNTRFEAFQSIVELIPNSEEIVLEWEDHVNQSVLYVISFSAIDHFLVSDFEMCAAMLEMALELDPEDHTEATKQLAYCYIALEEYELFDEIINDISDKYPEKAILKLWCGLRRDGRFADGELIHLKKNFQQYYNEFINPEHPVTEAYIQDIESERPSREALARELWLQTEHLWIQFPGFTQALKA